MNTKIGIFRALDVRYNHIDFASSFHKFQPRFIANITPEIKKYLTKEKIAYTDIPLKPYFLFDPVYSLLRKDDFTPWKIFDQKQLEEASADLDVYEIYEPYFFYSAQLASLAKKRKKPLVTEIWTSFLQHPSLYFPPYNLHVKKVINQTDLFVFRTQRAMSYLTQFSIPEHKKIVLYHGVDLEKFYPAKKSYDKVTILFVGALESHKGLDDLLDVFSELYKKYSEKIELIVCGEGSLQKRTEHLSTTLPIIYLGHVSHSELPQVYRQSDVYCQPSKDYYFLGVKGGEEFAGYTFMEALASGLPIIATYSGGIPEIVGNNNGLITQGNKKELFDALETYITDKILRQEVGVQNRKRAEKLFDLSKQVQTLEKVITNKLF